MTTAEPIFKRRTWLGVGFVLILSYLTYVHNFWYPNAFFWDENYHIAASQKYLEGVFFMEPHPPLGKLIIALSEKLVGVNERTDQFIGTDYARDPPPGFLFFGYRFLPALLGGLTAPLLYLIFLLLTRRHTWALLLSFLYLFDNAMIVHLRGAMLEGPLIFFVVVTILLYMLLLEWKDKPQRWKCLSLLFGVSFACAVTTKLNGLILIFLIPALFKELRSAGFTGEQFREFFGLSLTAFVLTFIAVWHTHFALGSKVLPTLPDSGYYQASEEYKALLMAKKNRTLLSFPLMLRDHMAFVSHYEKGVPRLDLCKPDENGSPPYLWPIGARSINYRWETPNSYSYQYLYLQANPAIWWIGLLAVILALSLRLTSSLLDLETKFTHRRLLNLFLTLYFGYMLIMVLIGRVLYLYHYFIPLLFSFVLLALLLLEVEKIGRFALTEKRKTALLFTLALLSFLSFELYRPFTYYEPITDRGVQLRAIVPLWDLHCVNCPKTSSLVIPRGWQT